MLDLRQNPTASALVPIGQRIERVTGRVIGRTFEADPMLDIRLAGGAIVQVRQSEADILGPADTALTGGAS